jgi:integrase
MATYRTKALSRDSRGNYRRDIGRGPSGTPQRFYLGRDEQSAILRKARLERLWQLLEADGHRCWPPFGIHLGQAIARGESSYAVPVVLPGEDQAYAHSMNDLNRKFGEAIALVPADEQAYFRGSQAISTYVSNLHQQQNQLISDHVAGLQKIVANYKTDAQTILNDAAKTFDVEPIKLNEPPIINGETATLYQALDAYGQYCKDHKPKLESGELKPNTRKTVERLDRLKEHHSDCLLNELTTAKLTTFVGIWRNRPLSKRGARMSKKTCEHHIKELFRFLNWLDASELNWSIPKGVSQISRKVEKFDSDKKLSALVKKVYSPNELAKLNKTATQWQRLALYLGLNCAMGAAELGRLTISDFVLKSKHDFSDQLGIASTDDDSWLRYFRPKTDVFGEWSLWPETVELVQWAITRAKKIGSDIIFCRETGTPLYDESTPNPQQGFANLWNRVKAQADFKADQSLPFGSLRDTLPDYLRQKYSSEIASLCLTHGAPGADQLIDCYANKPWAQLHKAIQEARGFYKPVFDALRIDTND